MPLVFAWLVSLQAASDVGPVVAEATDPPNSQLDRIPPGTHLSSASASHSAGPTQKQASPPAPPAAPLRRALGARLPSRLFARRRRRRRSPTGKRAASLTRDEARASASAPPRLSTRRAQSDDNGAPHERRRHVDILEPRAVHASRGRARRHGAASAYLPALSSFFLAH